MSLVKYLGAAAFTIGLSAALVASASFKNAGGTTLAFSVAGPGVTITGKGGRVSVSESDGDVKVTTNVKKFTTGMSMRDSHMHKYLHADEHPTATLVVKRSALIVPEEGKSSGGSATGELTLNGQTKSLNFAYKAKNNGGKVGVSALATVEMTNWGMEKPCLAVVCTDTKVKLKIGFTLKDD